MTWYAPTLETWIDPSTPNGLAYNHKFWEGNTPVRGVPVGPVVPWLHTITGGASMVHLGIDLGFWGCKPGETPDAFLTSIVTLDESQGLLNISIDWDNALLHTITAISFAYEYRGFTAFACSDVLFGDLQNPSNYSNFEDLPKTIVWDNSQCEDGSAPHISFYTRLSSPAFPSIHRFLWQFLPNFPFGENQLR